MKRALLLLILLSLLLYGCNSSRHVSRIRYQWDTVSIKRPVVVPIEGRTFTTEISLIEFCDSTGLDEPIQAEGNGVRIEVNKKKSRLSVKADCLPDTVRVPVEVKVPVMTGIEVECPPPDKELLKSKRSQGRTEGVMGILLLLLLLFIGRLLLKNATPLAVIKNLLKK